MRNPFGAAPASILWVLRHRGRRKPLENLRVEFAARGVMPSRIVASDTVAWMDHIVTKKAADIVLDTFLKNGHTSSADALWAGVPLVTRRGTRLGNRIASSLISNCREANGGEKDDTLSENENTNMASHFRQRGHNLCDDGHERRETCGDARIGQSCPY